MSYSRVRVIPVLLLRGESLVKTIKFKNGQYIGDPINTVRIFNELEVDELTILDITAAKEKRKPNFSLLESIASECFMPLAYGGGLTSLDDIKTIFNIGFEKVVLNSTLFSNPQLLQKTIEIYGSQAVVASIDYKKSFFGKTEVYSVDGSKKEKQTPKEWAITLEKMGAGEILLTSIDKDGTWEGYDLNLIRDISKELSIPLIASGGAGNLAHLQQAIFEGGASAVAVGSFVVYQKKDMGVLINFPEKEQLKNLFLRQD